MAKLTKIDSNQSGLRFCQETSIGILPAAASQIWYPLEPNSYQNFGQQVKTVARQPINAGRQRKKGVVTDVEASGGFQSDLTQTNMQRLLQGFFFADAREKATTAPITGAATVVMTATTTTQYTAASGLSIFSAGDLILASGFTLAQNNGLRNVTASAAGSVTVSQTLVVETPPAGAMLSKVGVQAASGDLVLTNTGSNFPTLTSTILDFTTLGLVNGEWIFIGGDTAATQFATAVNNGFARVRYIAAHTLTLDKTANETVTDAGTGKTIELFLGRVFRNEQGTLIKRRTFQLERILGANNDTDLTKQQAEYQVGACPNQFSINMKMADKIMVDLSYASLRESFIDENTTGANTLLSKQAGATAPAILDSNAFNTSTDVHRVKLSVVSPSDGAPTPLFAFAQDITIDIKNELKAAKAVGVTGAFEQTAGFFSVSGKLTAYFADLASAQAISANSDVSLDVHMVKNNAGVSIDLPVLTLGDGRMDVKQDEPILLPLTHDAGAGTKVDPLLNYTLLVMFWDWLPTAA